jgi:hypothetical protein
LAGAFGGPRTAGAPVLVAGRIAVWLGDGATFGAAAVAGFDAAGAGAGAELGADPVGAVAGGEFGVLATLVLGVPISLSRVGCYSVMRLCSCSAFLRRSANQLLTGQTATAAPMSPMTAGIVNVVCCTQLVCATEPDAT